MKKPHSRPGPEEKPDTLSYNPFEKLTIRPLPKRHSRPLPQKTDPGEDEELFREAMNGVREIEEFRRIPVPRPKAKPPAPRPDDTLLELERLVAGETALTLPDTSEYMEWTAPGVPRALARKLHEGEFAVQDHIDLHGLTLAEAEGAFRDFFESARRRGLFCIKVIHGRGLRSPNGPVLKEAVKGWLTGPYRRRIRAFATAPARAGGLGATCIVLKAR